MSDRAMPGRSAGSPPAPSIEDLRALQRRFRSFVEEHVIPAEPAAGDMSHGPPAELVERVLAIEVRDQRGAPLWRVDAAKGSFERRFPVGEPGFGFTEAVALRGLPDGEVEVRVAVGDVVDARVVDLRDADESPSVGASCGGQSVGAVGWVFAMGALMVVASYAAMLLRFSRERRRRG